MEDKKRTVMAVVIITVVLAAVLYSFFLNLFAPTPRLEMAHAVNPYGDGKACRRITDAVLYHFGRSDRPPEPFKS